MTAQRHEDMEPPECDMADQPVICEHCFSQAEDEDTMCADCRREADAINGIQPNGTEETATIRLPKFKTLDGRGTCGLDFAHDHLRCPLIRQSVAVSLYSTTSFQCQWSGAEIHTDNPDGSGYVRPCENCPIHAK